MALTVSVIISTYNRPERVVGAVKSAAEQTREPDEVIVVDDASDADYADAVRAFPDGVEYVELSENVGGAGARNAGAERASGDVLMFLDDDDRWRPEKVERQLALFDDADDETVLVYSGRVAVDERGNERYAIDSSATGDLSNDILIENCIGTTSGAAVRADVFEAVGGFDAELPGLQDWELWIRILQHGLAAYDPKHTVEWTVHDDASDQMTGQYQRYVLAIRWLRAKHRERFARLSWIGRRKARASQYQSIASKAANAGSVAKYRYIARSLFQWPTVSAGSRLLPQSILARLRA